MTNVYDQHRASFPQVSAYVVMRDGKQVATVAIKYPRDGAGRLYAYVHWFGVPMVRGYASGGGYDKRSAACASAARHMDWNDHTDDDKTAFIRALARDDGHEWTRALENDGFKVLQAV